MAQTITQEEFEALPSRDGTNHATINKAIRALPSMGGLKIPCEWNHYGRRGTTCSGSSATRYLIKARGWHIATRCKDGTFYVFRYE